MRSSWKLPITAVALIGGAAFSLAGLLTPASAAQLYAPITSAPAGARHLAAARTESAGQRHRTASSRRPYRRSAGAAPRYYARYGHTAGYRGGYFPYARAWHLGRSSEYGFGPRPTGQYRSFEQLDRFP